jgi:heat shock protein HtpX
VNVLKTFLLMLVLTVLVMGAGFLIGGDQGLKIAFVIALAMNFFSYWFSDHIAISMTRSRPLNERDAPEVYQALRELTHNAGMPMPRVYIMPMEQPNAFASGRNPDNAVISVTAGLLRMLNYEEIKGVLAHELAHIRNRDILVSTIAAVMAGALMLIARFGMWGMMIGDRNRNQGGPITALLSLLAIIIAPIAALLIRMAISRTREYGADATGAQLAGSPHGLASALQKMESYARRIPMQVNEAASHMFIVNPLSARGLSSLFSTHPPIRDRIRRLLLRHGY